MTKEEATEFFKLDRFASEEMGIVIDEVADGFSRVSMTVRDIHRAAHGGVMGGALFTLADFAFAVACNTPESITVTVSSNISFMSGAKSDELTAVCRRVKNGKRVCFCETEITDSIGTLVATVSAVGSNIGAVTKN